LLVLGLFQQGTKKLAHKHVKKTVSPSKHYSRHHNATEEEDHLRTPGKSSGESNVDGTFQTQLEED